MSMRETLIAALVNSSIGDALDVHDRGAERAPVGEPDPHHRGGLPRLDRPRLHAVDDHRRAAEIQGQAQVLVQTFRDIPIQVKVTDGVNEERVGLPERFGHAARELQAHFGADYLKERHWADRGVRYGTLAEGRIADLVLWDKDTLTPQATWIGGQLVYSKNTAAVG